jgi:signal transduction histidine kinase
MLMRNSAGAGGIERRSQVLIALLIAVMALAGILAYQAQDAARSHRATAEQALRGYASIAVWGLNRNAQEMLYSALVARLDSATTDIGGVPVDELLGSQAADHCGCFRGTHAGTRFALVGGGKLISEAPLPPAVRSWIVDSLRLSSGAAEGRREVGVGFPRGLHHAVAYSWQRGAANGAGMVSGFVAEDRIFGRMFGALMQLAPTLPETLLQGSPNDSVMSVEVATPEGRSIYHSPRVFAADFSATTVLPPMFGGLVIRVALRPDAVDRLVTGGVPHSRLPFLAGVLALSMALVAVVVLQVRREAELARMREDFVSSVSHELRTPLAQIRMFTETLLLGRTRSEAERRRSLEIIDQEARRLAHLVDNVLQVSRSGRGVSRVAPESVQLTRAVLETIEYCRVFAAQRRTELRPEVQEGVLGMVDPAALRQMLLNLVENAVKYGPAGQRVVVGLAVFGESARIWVDDEGPGIAVAERERIFEPFYRAKRDAISGVAGSGIGLAVVRELASLHEGRAWAEDAPGGGARLTIEIPGARVELPTGGTDSNAAA